MPPRGMSTRMTPIRLQTIDKLRIKRPNKNEGNPCIATMSAVLNCWATAGHTIQGCMALEQQLRDCSDTARPKKTGKSTINYHLSRMFPKMAGPKKKN